MTKSQKIDYYNVIKAALERKYPILLNANIQDESGTVTQEDIDAAIEEALAGAGISAGSIAALGNIIAVKSAYADLPIIDQLGNELTETDLALLTQDDGAHAQGIYHYNNGEWVKLDLNFGGTTDEDVTQEEVDQAIE